MRIENTTKKQSFGLKVPDHLKKTMLKIAREQKQEAYAQKKIFDIEHCLGNEYSLTPQFFQLKTQKAAKNSDYLALEIIKSGKDNPLELTKKNVLPDISEKEKNKNWYNMFMALTPNGIKKVVKEMGHDYLPL